MARPLRIQFENAIYHVTFRGNERRSIFRDDDDRLAFLERLEVRLDDYQVRLFIYCLMTNHVHLLVQTPLANISAFMGSLLTAYSTWHNRRHRRSGHLTQGRFASPLVEENDHLLWLSRYIHLNPVHIKSMNKQPLAEKRAYLRAYRWSSYRSYIGKVKSCGFVDHGLCLVQVAPIARDRPAAYRRYVEAGIGKKDLALEESMSRSPVAIGSEVFVRAMETRYEELVQAGNRREDLTKRATRPLIDPDVLLHHAARYYDMTLEQLLAHRKNDKIKPVLAQFLTRHARLNQRDTARYLGLNTGAAVCILLRKFREDTSGAMKKDYEEISRIFNI